MGGSFEDYEVGRKEGRSKGGRENVQPRSLQSHLFFSRTQIGWTFYVVRGGDVPSRIPHGGDFF
jgi:hypothetical protein